MLRASPPRSIFGRRGARLRTPMGPERSTSEPENAKDVWKTPLLITKTYL
jgi:hypothetical protein